MHTTPFCAYVFNLIFVNFSNNNNTFALPVFGYFKLVRLLCYIFCLFYVCLRRHTHTQAFSGTHTDTAAASVRFAAGILRAFCSCAAPATRLLQRQTEAAAATPAITTTTTCTCCHCVVLLSLVPIIWDHFEQQQQQQHTKKHIKNVCKNNNKTNTQLVRALFVRPVCCCCCYCSLSFTCCCCFFSCCCCC